MYIFSIFDNFVKLLDHIYIQTLPNNFKSLIRVPSVPMNKHYIILNVIS